MTLALNKEQSINILVTYIQKTTVNLSRVTLVDAGQSFNAVKAKKKKQKKKTVCFRLHGDNRLDNTCNLILLKVFI